MFFTSKIDVPAHHHGREGLGGGVFRLHGADVLATAQDGAPVGHGHYLRQLVGDEEYALALGGKVLHYHHELVDLLRGENGGGLVEDEYLVVTVEHLEYLGALLHTDGYVLDEGVRVHMEAVFFREGENLGPRLGLLKKAGLVGLHA